MFSMACACIPLLYIVLFISYAYGLDREYGTIKKSIIIDAKEGDKLGEIGIKYIDNPTIASEPKNAIAVDGEGSIYIADPLNQRIEQFNTNGKFKKEFKVKEITKKIDDIFVDTNFNLYLLVKYQYVLKISRNGHVVVLIDLTRVGSLKKAADGKIVLDKEAAFAGTNNRLYVDHGGNVYILGGDLLKVDSRGRIMSRFGPNIFDFYVDEYGNIFCDKFGEGISVYNKSGALTNTLKLTDEKGNYISSEWGGIRLPRFRDSTNNLYGITEEKGHYLAKYSIKNGKLLKFPLSEDDLISEYWTIDSKGNIYYTETSQGLKVVKLSVALQDK